MREETCTTTRYSPILGHEVVVRLTYSVGEGPRPDIVRWFLVREEALEVQDRQTLNRQVEARQDLNRRREATAALQRDESTEAQPLGTAQR